jgi:hypothetical protein
VVKVPEKPDEIISKARFFGSAPRERFEVAWLLRWWL